MQGKILFPTDFGPLGEKSRLTAAMMARKLDAGIVLTHAIHPPKGISRLFSTFDEESEREDVEKKLEEHARKLEIDGKVSVTTMVGEGNSEEAIVECARQIDARMIVLGTIGGEGLLDTVLGSPVNHVIRHAHCPVLTIRQKPAHLGFNRILVQLETLREAPEQVALSVKLAKLFNAELHFLGLMTGNPEHNRQLDNRVRNALKFAREERIGFADMHLEPLDNATEEEIEDYADHIHADLICVITQSDDEKGVLTRLRGSVADRVVNMSQHPVLSIAPSGDADPMI